jgi:ABC-2 type transporter/ABC transporter
LTDAAVVAEGLGKRFGPVVALDGVDLELPARSVLGLLGPNGSGKTTLVRILATLLRPDRGRARVAGFDVTGQPHAVRRVIGLSGQYATVVTGSAVLAGRVAADAVRNLFVLALMIGTGAAAGFRFHAGPAPALAAVGLAVAAGVAFSWVNLLLGLAVRDPETAGLAGLFPVVILFFTSSVLVPVATMPGWLHAFAKANPVTVITGALRALCLGGPTARPANEAIAWLAGLLAVTIPAAIARYHRHATSI